VAAEGGEVASPGSLADITIRIAPAAISPSTQASRTDFFIAESPADRPEISRRMRWTNRLRRHYRAPSSPSPVVSDAISIGNVRFAVKHRHFIRQFIRFPLPSVLTVGCSPTWEGEGKPWSGNLAVRRAKADAALDTGMGRLAKMVGKLGCDRLRAGGKQERWDAS
jgi:hypothetical protein